MQAAQAACEIAIEQCHTAADSCTLTVCNLPNAALELARPIKADTARLADRQRELTTWEEARALLLRGGRKEAQERRPLEAALLALVKLLLAMRQGAGKHAEAPPRPPSARNQAEPTRQALQQALQAVRESEDAGLDAARDARDAARIAHLDALDKALNSGLAGRKSATGLGGRGCGLLACALP